MPGEIEKVAELEGQVTDLETQVASLTKKLEKMKAAAGGDDPAAMAAELTGQLDEVTSSLEQATEAMEKLAKERDDAVAKATAAEAIAKLSSAEKDHCDGMSEEDKTSFMAMKPEDRQKAMKKRADEDESVVIEGQTIRKSVVGEAPFAVMKAQAARIEKNEKDLATERTARETVVLEKRADDQYSHVPGTIQERGAMLGAIDKMDEPLKKSFLAVFEQSEKMAKAGFDKIGSGGGKDPSKSAELQKASRDFDGKVNDIKKRDNCTRTEALAKARKEHPDLFKVYQDSEAATAN